MQRETERDLIAAWQEGNLTAARQLVSLLQADALNVAWLLTGNQASAVALAESAFLVLLERSRTDDLDTDRRAQLLTLLGQSFLRGDYRARIEENAPAFMPLQQTPARFNVDNRRSLIMAALGRLEDRERVALVLQDFSGLEVSELTRLAERRNDPLLGPMDTARLRVRQSLDLPAGEPLRRTFVEATFDAPRIDLWQRLEEPITDIHSRKRNQARLITFGVLAVIAVALVGGFIALFGDTLFDSATDNGNRAAAQPIERPTMIIPTPTILGTATPEPTPALPAFPQADIPSWLLLETWSQEPGEETVRGLSVFDPQENRRRRLPSNTPLQVAAGSDQFYFSPDGYQMVLFREETVEEQIHYYATSYSTDAIGRQWETEVLTVAIDPDIAPGSHVPARLAAAVTGDRVYTASLTTHSTAILKIDALFRRNGMPRGSLEITLPRQNIDNRVFRGNIYLFAPPEGDRLYALVESFGDTVSQWRTTILIIDRNAMTLLGEKNVSADPDEGLWLWHSRMTADGSALYGIHQNRFGTQARVQFLELETGELTALDLPFALLANQSGTSLMPLTSHNGQHVYILDQHAENVAIVNLARRRIERVFPLDRRGFEEHLGVAGDNQTFVYGSSLSADGTRIYLAAWNQNIGTNDINKAGIWIIDTTLWKIEALVPVDGLPSDVFLSPAEDAIYAQVWTRLSTEPYSMLVKIATDGEPRVVQTLDLPRDGHEYVVTRAPSALYQAQYGHSPAIDEVPLTDSSTSATLPRLEVHTTPAAVAAGQTVSIEVRIVDPVNGTPITTARDDLRYDPGAGVTATVHAPDGRSQIVFLGPVEGGIYRGGAVMPTTGIWSVDISLTDDAGQPWVAGDAGKVTVVPAFTGSDGRTYIFMVTTEPEYPVAERMATVQLWLVDAQTGVPMPETVSVTIEHDGVNFGASDDLPGEISVSFAHFQPAALTAHMTKLRNGYYEGMLSFWTPGRWSPIINLSGTDGTRTTLPANPVYVVRS